MEKNKDCYWAWETKNDKDFAERLEGRVKFMKNKEFIELLNQFKGEVLSLRNRDDKIHAKILMPDGGGVDRFVITRKIEELIKLLERGK